MAELAFNPQEYTPLDEIIVIPAGEYIAEVFASKMQENKKQTGWMLILNWRVIDGEHKGAEVSQFVNLMNASAEAQAIAQRMLSTICKACGVDFLQDSEQLHEKPCRIKVKLQEYNGEIRDAISMVFPVSKTAAPAKTKGETVAQKTSAEPVPPWLKGKNR